VAEAERAHRKAVRIPVRLAQEIAVAASEGQAIWAQARAARDFAAFAPALRRNIALKREMAACLSAPGDDPYAALLDEFEPGMPLAVLAPMLEGLRPGLTALRAAIAERPAPAPLTGAFDSAAQLALAREVASALGYDFEAGRLDLSAHPFSSGVGGDARITTRVDPDNPLDCLYATIHETGHALYAQGAPDPFLPSAQYASMGVHESQSRFWENQIGRSRPFADWLAPRLGAAFENTVDPETLYAATNRVESGFIRTEADEVHYNLHILMRFDLERALIAGDLSANDLEAAWNDRFAADFSHAPPDAARGALQDVHWAVGLFGYFPTYSLGNIYAACLDAAMRRALPERDALVAAGDFAPILGWMRDKVHAHGRVLPPPQLIEAATGKPPTPAPLLEHLRAKFGALYGL
jgi:carboxypeptidase Taq